MASWFSRSTAIIDGIINLSFDAIENLANWFSRPIRFIPTVLFFALFIDLIGFFINFKVAQYLYCIGLIFFLVVSLFFLKGGRSWKMLYDNVLPTAVLFLLVAIVYDFALSSYDISGLYWGPDSWTCFIAGFTVCTLIFMVFFTIFCAERRSPKPIYDEIIEEVDGNGNQHRDSYTRYFVLQQSLPWIVLISMPALVVEPVLDSKSREGWEFEWTLISVKNLMVRELFFDWLLGVAVGYAVFQLLSSWLMAFSSTGWFWGCVKHLITHRTLEDKQTLREYLASGTPKERLERQTSSLHLVSIVIYIFLYSIVLGGLVRILESIPNLYLTATLSILIVIAICAIYISKSLQHEVQTARRGFYRSISWFIGLTCLLLLLGVLGKWLGSISGYFDYTFIFTAALSIGFVLAALLAGYGFLVTRSSYKWHGVTLVGIGVGILFNGWDPDKITVPGLDKYYDKVVESRPNLAIDSYDRLEQNDLSNFLLSSKGVILPNWKRERDKGANNRLPKVLIVTTSGGASRACVWTVAVLDAINVENSEILKDIRLITGASGGMVGAACYVSAWNAELDDPTQKSAARTDLADTFKNKYPDIMTPILTQLAMRDLPSLPLPWKLSHDRGRELEQVFERICPSLKTTTFESLYENEKAGKLPSLVFSPFMVEDGRRMFISNLALNQIAMNLGPLDGIPWDPKNEKFDKVNILSRSGVEFFRLFPDAHKETFKVVTAARMNATFPYLSPSVPIPTNPPRRFMDAGVYDNYGVNLALMWITQNAEWLESNTSGVGLIQIRAFSNENRLKDPSQTPNDGSVEPPNRWERGTQFLTSPPTAVDASRMAINYFRNDGQIENISRWFNMRKPGKPFFQTFIFSYDQEIDSDPNSKKGPMPGKSDAKHKRDKEPETLSWTLNKS